MKERPTTGTRSAVPLGTVAHFELMEELGRGGMGVVYRARDTRLGRDVALKRPYRAKVNEHGTRERFMREARTASRLSHANIIPIHEILEYDGLPWLAMDLVVGSSLKTVLEQKGPPPLDDMLRYAEELTDALRAAHRNHVLHRDITPNNVFLNDDGHALLGDFGLATWFITPDENSIASTATTVLTATGAIIGTQGYMSPEQSLGRAVDPRSDIFSLGTVLYEMCSGKAAFRAHSAPALLDAVLHTEPPPLDVPSAGIPAELTRIIAKSMAKDPDHRYASATEMLDDFRRLRRWHQSSSSAGLRTGLLKAGDHLRRHRRGALFAAMTLAVVTVAGVWLVWKGSENPSRDQADSIPAIQATMSPLVTWPSSEVESRLSPNGRWVSFISDRDNETNIWVQDVSGSRASRLSGGQGPFYSHGWSPDGNEIAYLTGSVAEMALHVISAPLGGIPRINQPLDEAASRIVRWTAQGIFLETFDGLALMNLQSGIMKHLPHPEERLQYDRYYDVDAAGRRAVFSGVGDGQENLWVTDLDSGTSVPLQTDDYTARWPLWIGSDSIVYASNRSGPLGLWMTRPTQQEPVQLPLNRTIYRPVSVAADGSKLTVEVQDRTSDIWVLDRGSGSATPATADTLQDFQVSAAGDRIVFQRGKPTQEHSVSFFDSRIVMARITPQGIRQEEVLDESGYAPRISPDGRWVAFLRITDTAPNYTDLWLMDLRTLRTSRISEKFHLVGLSPAPQTLLNTTLAWAAEGPTLFFVTFEEGNHSTIRSVTPTKSLTPKIVALNKPKAWSPGDLHIDTRGRLSLMTSTDGDGETSTYSLEVYDEDGSQWIQAYQEALGPESQLRLVGWLSNEQFILQRAHFNPERDYRVEILLGSEGVANLDTLAELPHAFPATTYLDRVDGHIYITAADSGIHNVAEINLPDASMSLVTRNLLPGVTFADFLALPDDSLLFGVQRANSDIWIVDLK